MTQVYSDPSRESEPHALPDVEVFYLDDNDIAQIAQDNDNDGEVMSFYPEPGWYWWSCFPAGFRSGWPIRYGTGSNRRRTGL